MDGSCLGSVEEQCSHDWSMWADKVSRVLLVGYIVNLIMSRSAIGCLIY